MSELSNNHFLTRDGRWVTIGDDELYHYKYIKREKVNGKWRYYYDNEEYRAYKKAASEANYAKSVLRDTEKAYDAAKSRKRNAIKDLLIAEFSPGDTMYPTSSKPGKSHYEYTTKGKAIVDAQSDIKRNRKEVSNLKDIKREHEAKKIATTEAAIKAKTAYEKTAGAKVADLLTTHANAIDKVEKMVNKLFSKKKKRK